MVTIRENGDFEFTKWVVEQGADVAVMCPQGSAVHNAVDFATEDLLGYLLKHGGDKLLSTADSRGFTPLILAANSGKDENIKYLVKEWKVDVNFQTDVTALLMAVQNRHISTTKLLISLGADVNAQHESMKCTALHLAASNEFLDIVEILLKNNAKIDCEDPRGYTPLGMAGTEGYTKCVEMLLKAGADPNHRAHSDNTTAIFHCSAKNRVGVVHLLLQAGADPLSTRYENGDSIIDVARANKKDTMANLISGWLVAGNPEERAKICVACYNYKKGEMKRCSKCKSVWYCSAECQRKEWPQHKLGCVQQK